MSKKKHIDPEETKRGQVAVLKGDTKFDSKKYEYDDRFQDYTGDNPLGIHSVPELVEALKKDKKGEKIEIEARVIFAKEGERWGYKKLKRDSFLEAIGKRDSKNLRESFDAFGMDLDNASLGPSGSGAAVGHDYVPLLGGPFNKQLYYYDYLKMHALSFHASNHDPVAKGVLDITKNFVIGRGYRADVESDDDNVKEIALALWRAYEEVNNLPQLIEDEVHELSCYGEIMEWYLPNNEIKIGYRLPKGQEVPRGIIPRVRLIDPSTVWEIVTYPEDITRRIYYQLVFPTQYQLYTAPGVPTTKFIYQQVPAAQVHHYKINSVSNEKRGRSDLFPILGYLKRLRDAVEYQMIAMMKQAAYAIDTSIEGSQTDVDNYINALNSLGTIPDAGSEFAHTSKIKRQFMSNTSGHAGQQEVFAWCWSMISAGSGIPMSYFGNHLSGAQTRASALVSTDPVAKKFEMRQALFERILKKHATRLFKQFGINAELAVTFPELVIQDRSAKLKDLALAEAEEWFSHERASIMAAKELGATEYEYEAEVKEINKDYASLPIPPQPLGAPGITTKPDQVSPGRGGGAGTTQPTGTTSQAKKALSDNNGF